MKELRIESTALRQFYLSAFEKMGLESEDARVASEGLLYSDLHGLDSHGAANFRQIYISGLQTGTISAKARPRVIRDRFAVATVDGRRALGFVTGRYCIREAIVRARDFGIGVIAARNSTHNGSLGFYVRECLKSGMIGIAATNCGAQGILRPPGGLRELLGTNAFAFGAPGGRHGDYLLDMSTAVVSTGRIKAEGRKGNAIPAGWLENDDGKPVLDAADYEEGLGHLLFLGSHLQTGAYKGYGLAMMVDLLCGILSGGPVGPNRRNLKARSRESASPDEGIGHFFLALNISDFRDSIGFVKEIEEMLDVLTLCPPRNPDQPVIFPGVREREQARKRAAEGIPLDPCVYRQLAEVAEELAIPAPEPIL